MTSWPTSQLPPTSAPDPHIGPRWAFGARFSPHVLVLLATVYVTWGPASRALVTGVFWWWADSYRQVELVMEDAQPNAGSPYIDGRVEGLDGVVRLVGVMQDGVIAPRAAPFAVFAPGKRLPIWHSDLAPNFVVEGVEVNDVPVSSRPTLPSTLALLDQVAMALATLGAGLYATLWVGQRWARRWGTLPIRRSTTA